MMTVRLFLFLRLVYYRHFHPNFAEEPMIDLGRGDFWLISLVSEVHQYSPQGLIIMLWP